jgi:hypothetical protein
LLPQVKSIIGLVLKTIQLFPPNAGLSQEFKHVFGQAFACNTHITCNISAIQLLQHLSSLQHLSLSLLHI